MRRWLRVLILALACATAVSAQPRSGNWGQTRAAYDGRFTFVRLRWRSGSSARTGVSGINNNNFYLHEFPLAEQNFMAILKDVTLVDARTDGSLILTLDDPQLFKYPIAVMWEPGFWRMSDDEAESFRAYLLKGGFVVFHDFELDQWDNFEAQMLRVLPNARWIELDETDRIFDSFFRLRTIYFPHPPQHHLYGFRTKYFGLFEDNDRTRRLMAIANHNTNLAEYWQWLGQGLFPVDSSNEAFKLGVNYMMYGLTH
jgi:hypothetical protein